MKLINKATGIVAMLAAGVVSASPVSSEFFTGFQQLSDNSAEYLINADGSTIAGGGDTVLGVGDRLVGIFQIETIEQGGSTNILGSGGVNELTGVFDLTVAFKGGGPGAYTFGFVPTALSGVAVSLYEDLTPDYQRIAGGGLTTIAQLTGTATDGSLWAELGFGAATDFWNSFTQTDDLAVLGSIPAPGNGGGFNVGLSILSNFSGLDFDQVACFDPAAGNTSVDVCGSGSLLGVVGHDTPFDSFNNIDFTVNVIPEPASLALLGLGLVGLGASTRRRKA